MSDTWRCEVCKKTKDLSGDHLRGKTTVRSDCWPCAKKQTFQLHGATSTVSSNAEAKTDSTTATVNPFSQGTTPNVSSRNVFTVTSTNQGTAASSSPFGNGPSNPFSVKDASGSGGNPFAQGASRTGSAPIAAASNSTTSSGNRSPIIIKSAFSESGRGTSPSFTFSAAAPVHTQVPDAAAHTNPFLAHAPSSTSTSAAPWTLPSSTTALKSVLNASHTTSNPFASNTSASRPKAESATPTSEAAAAAGAAPNVKVEDNVWRCAVCHKAKDLSGAHLNGKTSVRSDCWPCAKKQTFLRGGASQPAAQPPQNAGKSAQSASVFTDPHVATSAAGGSALWEDPIIPQLTTSQANTSSSGTASSKTYFLSSSNNANNAGNESGVSTGNANALSSAPPFEALLLLQYRQQLVSGIRLRTSWGTGVSSDNTLYVIAPQPSLSATQTANAKLGQYASLFLAIEHKLSSSPFRRLQRIFCPTEFSYAAACMYSSCMSDNATAPLISVYGPQVDHTATLSEYGAIIQNSAAVGNDRVVSADARVDASRSIYQNCGWLVSPAHATAEAIRLQEALSPEDSASAENGLQSRGANVVVIPQVMSLQELPQAIALAHRTAL